MLSFYPDASASEKTNKNGQEDENSRIHIVVYIVRDVPQSFVKEISHQDDAEAHQKIDVGLQNECGHWDYHGEYRQRMVSSAYLPQEASEERALKTVLFEVQDQRIYRCRPKEYYGA